MLHAINVSFTYDLLLRPFGKMYFICVDAIIIGQATVYGMRANNRANRQFFTGAVMQVVKSSHRH